MELKGMGAYTGASMPAHTGNPFNGIERDYYRFIGWWWGWRLGESIQWN